MRPKHRVTQCHNVSKYVKGVSYGFSLYFRSLITVLLILAALKAIYLFGDCCYQMRTYCGPTCIPYAFVAWFNNMLSFYLFVCLFVLGTILTFLDCLGIVATVNLSFACLENLTCCAFNMFGFVMLNSSWILEAFGSNWMEWKYELSICRARVFNQFS